MLRPNYKKVLQQLEKAGQESLETLSSFVSSNPLPGFIYPKRPSELQFEYDLLSTSMIPQDTMHTLVAAYTKGDGNCLYNSLSMLMAGDCSYAEELRCRVLYELIRENDLDCKASDDCLYYDTPSKEYLHNMARPNTFSGVIEVMAAANVLGADIACHYPDVNHRIRPYFNKTFKAGVKRRNAIKMHIMITRAGSMRDHRVAYWNPDHFVCLVPRQFVKSYSPWYQHRDKWLEVVKELEEIADTVPPVVTIDDSDSDHDHEDTDEIFAVEAAKRTANESDKTGVELIATQSHALTLGERDGDSSNDKRTDNVNVDPHILASPKDSITCTETYTPYNDSDVNKSVCLLVKYALTVSGVTSISSVHDASVWKFDEFTNYNNIAFYTKINTVEPPTMKGWGKYNIMRTTREFRVHKRRCKGNRECGGSVSDTCNAEIIYISKCGSAGTLMIPTGNHAPACKDNLVEVEPKSQGFESLLTYMGHVTDDVIRAQDPNILDYADGNKVYVLPIDVMETNTAPMARNWGKLNSYKTSLDKNWKTQQRKCKSVKCSATIRYFRSKETPTVVVQHIGDHTYSPVINVSSSVDDPIAPNLPSRQITEKGHFEHNNRKRPTRTNSISDKGANVANEKFSKLHLRSHDATLMTPGDTVETAHDPKLNKDHSMEYVYSECCQTRSDSPIVDRELLGGTALNWGEKDNYNSTVVDSVALNVPSRPVNGSGCDKRNNPLKTHPFVVKVQN